MSDKSSSLSFDDEASRESESSAVFVTGSAFLSEDSKVLEMYYFGYINRLWSLQNTSSGPTTSRIFSPRLGLPISIVELRSEILALTEYNHGIPNKRLKGSVPMDDNGLITEGETKQRIFLHSCWTPTSNQTQNCNGVSL